MPTICSAMRKGDRTVGTSTNCSADCGSGIREREGHGEQEILGTSITCSAIGRSRIRKVSATWSTICGTGRSRICTNGQTVPKSSTQCRSTHTCQPATSDRGAGWPPAGGGVFGIFAVKCVSYSSPFLVLVAAFWFRKTPLAVPTLRKEWWVTVARTRLRARRS